MNKKKLVCPHCSYKDERGKTLKATFSSSCDFDESGDGDLIHFLECCNCGYRRPYGKKRAVATKESRRLPSVSSMVADLVKAEVAKYDLSGLSLPQLQVVYWAVGQMLCLADSKTDNVVGRLKEFRVSVKDGYASVCIETGMPNDEGTYASLLCRYHIHMFITAHGGMRSCKHKTGAYNCGTRNVAALCGGVERKLIYAHGLKKG